VSDYSEGRGIRLRRPSAIRQWWAVTRSDLWRYRGCDSLRDMIAAYRWYPGYRYSFWLRVAQVASRERHALVERLAAFVLGRCSVRYGIAIPYRTQIGAGFYIGHFGGIVVADEALIGRNVNLSQGVTIGWSNRGALAGVPRIGNDVYIGPGAVIFGAVDVGEGAAIGANAVVCKSVPEWSVAVGVPARVVSQAGSAGYVNRTDYPVKDLDGWL
jgi:serine O-acetyltransferase